MADTPQRSDFNVETHTTRDMTQPADSRPAADELIAEQVRRACAELEQVCAQLTGEAREALRARIDSIQTQLTSGVSPALLLATAVPAARTEAQGYQQAEATRTQAALYNGISISAPSMRHASVQFDAIMNGDIVVIANRSGYGAFEDEMPPAQQALISKHREGVLQSNYGKRVLDEIQQAGRENPEGTKQELAAVEERKARLEQFMLEEKDPHKRALIERLLRTNAYTQPETNAFITAYEQGQDINDLKTLVAKAENRAEFSMRGTVPYLRQQMAEQTNIIINAAPEQLREKLRHDDGEYVRYLMRQQKEYISHPELRQKYLEEYSRTGDFSKLSNEAKEYFAIDAQMRATAGTMGMVGALRGLGRAVTLEQQLEAGGQLSAEQMQSVENLRTIRNADVPLADRAKLLIESTQKDITPNVRPAALRNLQRNASSNLALSALSLAFADSKEGGLDHFGVMMERAQKMAVSGKPDPEATQYVQEYQNFISQRLIGEPMRLNDPEQSARLSIATERLGAGLRDGSITVNQAGGELRFYKVNEQDYVGSTVLYADQQDMLVSSIGGYGRLMNTMYQESQKQTDMDPARRALIQQMDTYRLQAHPEAHDMINAVWRNEGSVAEIETKVRTLLQEERAGMQPYLEQSIPSMTSEQRAILQHYNLLADDDTVNLEALMKQVEINKTQFYHLTEQYKNVPTSELPPDFAAARQLSEFITPIRAAHSLEHVRQMAEVIDNQVTELMVHNKPIPEHLANDQQMLQTILSYEPGQDATAFRQAVRTYLERDSYVQLKENADREKRKEGRTDLSNLVESATDLILEKIEANPNLLRNTESHEHATTQKPDHSLNNQNNTPIAATVGSTTTVVAPIQAPQEPAALAPVSNLSKLDAREREGSSGGFDDLHKTELEKAIIGAVQGLSPETRRQMLGGLEAIQHIEAQTKDNTDFISYNEIEKALKKAGVKDVAELDRDKDGRVSIEEIAARLAQSGASRAQVASTEPQAATTPATAGNEPQAPALGR